MNSESERKITFARLSDDSRDEIAEHMSDPRVAEHMPLLTPRWSSESAARFVAEKEASWRRDGLGHWAILCNGRYVGWGGFQKEGDEWDFGLVLKPAAFGLGRNVVEKALGFAIKDHRIPFVTFLLPLSQKNIGALGRIGAEFVGEVEYGGASFRKFRLDTKRCPLHRCGKLSRAP